MWSRLGLGGGEQNVRVEFKNHYVVCHFLLFFRMSTIKVDIIPLIVIFSKPLWHVHRPHGMSMSPCRYKGSRPILNVAGNRRIWFGRWG